MRDSITFIKRANYTKFGFTTMTVDSALDYIRDGNLYLFDKAIGVYCLQHITEFIHLAQTKQEVQERKLKYLPAVAFNGVFTDGNLTNDGMMVYSEFTALDFDNFPTQQGMTAIYSRLVATPCVYAVFITPSGRGLKAIIRHDNQDPKKHHNLYKQLLRKFQINQATNDTSCCDLRRLSYLVYDPNIYVNKNATPYHFVFDPTLIGPVPFQFSTPPITQSIQNNGTYISDISIMNILKYRCRQNHPEYFVEGNRRNGVFWFGTQCGKAGVDYQKGLEYTIKVYTGNDITYTTGNEMPEKEIAENFKSGYSKETYNEDYRQTFKKY